MAIMILVLASNLLANLALGQSDGHESTVIITARPGYSPPADDGPGSGPGCPEGEVVTYERASITGLVFQGFTVRSPDRRFSLFLDEGIVVLTPDGQCPQCIGIHEMTPPPPPEGAQFVGAVYNAIPDLTAFTPPATIIYSYDPADIPDGFSAESLVIALRDPATEEWMKLDGVLDTQAHTITARIGRFNDLAVLCYEPQEPEPTALTPTLTPAPTLTSTPTLTPTPTPTLPPTPLAATPGSTTNWWLIGGIAAAAAAVAAVAIFLFRRRF